MGDIGAGQSPYEETRELSGEALIEALDLKPLDVPRGEWINEDDSRLGDCAAQGPGQPRPEGAVTVSTGEAVYCLAGIARTDLEAWDLSNRIMGHVPCELEEEAFLLLQEAEQASEDGAEELERALEGERATVLSQAKDDPACQ